MLEVAQGGIENWQKHLIAVRSILPFLRGYCPVMQLYAEPHRTMEDLTSEELQEVEIARSTLSFADHAAVIFYSSVCIWFDTLGCASTGVGPQYFHIHSAMLGDNSKLQLQKIMGCENWTMVLIREIAVLMESKKRLDQGDVLRDLALRQQAISVEHSLRRGIIELVTRFPKAGENMKIHQVTHAFACAAQVYLKVLLHGPNSTLPEIQEAVSSTLLTLFPLSEAGLLRNAVWPFCIAGCMASKDQQHAFGDLASDAGMCKNGFVLGTSSRALEVVTTCWKIREEEAWHCDWFDAMEKLGYHVLLV